MCQALLDDPAARVGGSEQLRNLVDHLLLPDIPRDNLSSSPQFASEKLAEVAAIELLCPVLDRKKIAPRRASGAVTDNRIAIEFRVPVTFIKRIFDQKYIDLMEKLIWTPNRGKAA